MIFCRPFFFLCLLEDMAASMSLSSAGAEAPAAVVPLAPVAACPPAAGSSSLTWVGGGAVWAPLSTLGLSSLGSAATLGASSLGSAGGGGVPAGGVALHAR